MNQTNTRMAPTTVIHARDLARHPDAVYIGREHAGRGRGPSFKRSRWANPWSVNDYGRDAAIALYARWITGDPQAAAMLPPGRWHRPSVAEIRDELRGRVLACWCDPEPCHGHVLAAIADERTPCGEVPQGNPVNKGKPLMDAGDRNWWVFSTALKEVVLMLECRNTGAFGIVPDPNADEWARAFHAPTDPYPWDDPSRVVVVRES